MTTAPMIGHNNPPPDPFTDSERAISDLYAEASNWLDGEAIANQSQADQLAKLLEMIRDARKEADALRVEEKRPHDEAAKAVQAKWKPLLDRCDTATTTAKKALTPWLAKIEAEKRAEEDRKRAEAEAAQKAAREAAQKARQAHDLAAAEEANRLADEAMKADRIAKAAAKQTGTAKGGRRAVSLRTTYHAEVTDYADLIWHIWEADTEAMKDFALEYAQRHVREYRTAIPGVNVIEKKEAV